MYFLSMFNIIISINLINIKHPLVMGFMLLMQTIIITMICGLHLYSYWFSYILFLIMLGGMLVLFMYMTSLASNEIFSLSFNWVMFSFTFIIAFTMIMIFMDQFLLSSNNLETMMFHNNTKFTFSENEINLIKLYNNPTMNLTILMMTYLLLTLIIIVKITKISYGPLRQMN
uniref:NADH dehydrogenase subunit 6 n=1 Tax=Semirhynchia dumbrodiana TaxID=3056118 RepID=UPI003002F68B|nr:NADH dehydrogenase subunit 6 [Semirhynchia dumbrodiana]